MQPLPVTPVGASFDLPAAGATPTATHGGNDPYPPPGGMEATPSPVGTLPTNQPYPPPQGTAYPSSTAAPVPTIMPSVTGTVTPPVTGTGTPPATGTVALSPTIIPTVYPSGTLTTTAILTSGMVGRLPEPLSPPPAQLYSTVSIWHSWSEAEVGALWSIIASFQQSYPNVGFDLIYVPPDELQDKFSTEAYLGGGPSLLFAPAEWGSDLAKNGLVVDFTPYVNPDFLATLNQAGLGTGRYHGELISLPYALRGVLLYRNQTIIPQPAASFEELIALCQAVSVIGAVGADMDRGIFFTGAHLEGLGGRLMDEAGNPAFNNAAGVEWVNLLKSFDQLGVTTFNSNRDRQLFEQGKVGLITETSGNLRSLANAVGSDNLAIDPWPSYAQGHLSGYVLADSVYLNANLSSDDLMAALAFTGYFLSPEVQRTLAEVGHIPSGLNVPVRDRLIQQAETAFANGTSFPVNPEAQMYWSVLESALLDVFNGRVDPATALQRAYDVITTRLAEIRK